MGHLYTAAPFKVIRHTNELGNERSKLQRARLNQRLYFSGQIPGNFDLSGLPPHLAGIMPRLHSQEHIHIEVKGFFQP